VPAVVDPDARVGLRDSGGHRHGDGGWLRPSHGTAGARRPDRSRHDDGRRTLLVRAVQGASLRSAAAAEPYGRGRPAGPEVGPRVPHLRALMRAEYRPPLTAIDLALGAVGLHEVLALPPFEHLGVDDVEGVLAGFGR